MQYKFYLFILLCLSSLGLQAQIEVDWTTTSFDYSDKQYYLGVYPLASFDGKTLLAHKLISKTIADKSTWGFEFLDATTGEAMGDLVSTSDIPSLNTIDADPELNRLIKTGNGYMSFLRNGNQITFVNYDKELNFLEPVDEASEIVRFNPSTRLSGYGNMVSAATSYGMVGAAYGIDDNTAQSEAIPHLFACDTSLNVRFSRRLENAEYYLGNRFSIAVNTQDEIFTAGHTKGQEYLRSDTVVISKLGANGTLLYTNFLVLPPASLPRLIKMDISPDETELLLSGMILTTDDLSNRTTSKAYIARINAQDGSLIKLFTFFAREVGGVLGAFTDINSHVELPMAQYDAQGNIVLTSIVIDEQGAKDIEVVQMDVNGKVLNHTKGLSNLNGFPYPFSYRLNRVGNIHYLSGSYQITDSEEKEAFVIKLGLGAVVTNISENIITPISFKISPNPTNGLLNIQWNNDNNGTYQVKIINQLSQEIQNYSGSVFSGQVNLEFNLEHLPAGTYFMRLELENGFAIQPIIKK